MTQVLIEPLDEVHVRVRTDLDAAHDIKDLLTFDVPGAKFTPRYKIGAWDGKVSLFNPYNPILYKGLIGHIVEMCETMGHSVVISKGTVTSADSITPDEKLRAWAEEVTPDGYDVRDYQVDSFVDCVRLGRRVVLSSTSSGKTLMMYRLGLWYHHVTNKPTLVLTTRTNLVAQAKDDFEAYGDVNVTTIDDAAREVNGGEHFVVCTWQSALRAPEAWFSQFGCILADEVHSWDSSAFQKIAVRWKSIKYRFGMTGSLKDGKINKLTLVGLFGDTAVASTNRERIAAGDVARPKITMIRLIHPAAAAKHVATGRLVNGKKRPMLYPNEVLEVLAGERRARVLIDLVKSLKGNTLILFNRNDAFGVPMLELMTRELGETLFVNGSVSTEERRRIQRVLEETPDGVRVLASLGTFSEGMSTNNIKNVVFAYPMKGQVRLLQSVGRGIRKMEGKTVCRFYDLVDDLRVGRHENFLWRHAVNRCETYDTEGFEYKWIDVDLNNVDPIEFSTSISQRSPSARQ